jgi:hypothetical protein
MVAGVICHHEKEFAMKEPKITLAFDKEGTYTVTKSITFLAYKDALDYAGIVDGEDPRLFPTPQNESFRNNVPTEM